MQAANYGNDEHDWRGSDLPVGDVRVSRGEQRLRRPALGVAQGGDTAFRALTNSEAVPNADPAALLALLPLLLLAASLSAPPLFLLTRPVPSVPCYDPHDHLLSLNRSTHDEAERILLLCHSHRVLGHLHRSL